MDKRLRDMCTNSLPKMKCINRDFIVKKAPFGLCGGVSHHLLLVFCSFLELTAQHDVGELGTSEEF